MDKSGRRGSMDRFNREGELEYVSHIVGRDMERFHKRQRPCWPDCTRADDRPSILGSETYSGWSYDGVLAPLL